MQIKIEKMLLDTNAASLLREMGCVVDQPQGIVICPEGSVLLFQPEKPNDFGIIRFTTSKYMLWQRTDGDQVVLVGQVAWKDDDALFDAANQPGTVGDWLKELLLHRLQVVCRYLIGQAQAKALVAHATGSIPSQPN